MISRRRYKVAFMRLSRDCSTPTAPPGILNKSPTRWGFFSSRHQKSALRRLSDRLVEPERVVEIRCAKEHGRRALRFRDLAALAPSGSR